MKIPFGKHRGLDMEDIPANYLKFISEQDWITKWPAVEAYVQANMAGIKKQIADGRGEV